MINQLIRPLLVIFFLTTLFANTVFSQKIYVDAPEIYFVSHDFSSIGIDAGLGVASALSIGNDYLMAKTSLGIDFTSNLGGNISEFFEWTPFFKTEIGAGIWRSHFNRQSEKKWAYTLMPKAGFLYLFRISGFSDPSFNRDAFNPYVGFELALNTQDEGRKKEIFFDNGLLLGNDILFLRLGFRLFFELN